MSKTPQTSAFSVSKNSKAYSYKPLMIGAVIKNLAEEKHITPSELAKLVGVNKGNIYRLFKARTMQLPMLFKMSEALQENLLLLYHPNVKPLSNPLEKENAELKEENKQFKEQAARFNQLQEENKVLKAKLEVLTEVMKGK